MTRVVQSRSLRLLLAAAMVFFLFVFPASPSYPLAKPGIQKKVTQEKAHESSLRRRAGDGDAAAQEELGESYRWGRAPVRRDLVNARRWLELAAKSGRATSRLYLAQMLMDGEGGPKDEERAKQLLTAAAMQGNARAQSTLGYVHITSKAPGGHTEGMKWILAAAKQGDTYALDLLAYETEFGPHVERTRATAERVVDLMIRGAQLGDKDAALRVGEYLYNSGRDIRKAVAFLNDAASRGHPRSAFMLGYHYWNGTHEPRNGQLAARWLTKSLDGGFEPAALLLAECYAAGFGVPKDAARAGRLFATGVSKASPGTLNQISWLLAASPIDELRDGKRAVLMMQKALEKKENVSPARVDTLAAAYAEAGQFAEAVKAQRQAIALLAKDAQWPVRSDLESRLKLYLSGKPYRITREPSQQ